VIFLSRHRLAPVSTADPPAVLIELEGHGREPIQFETDPHQTLDLTRTIGWFTSLYPVRFDTLSSEQFGQNPGKAFEAVQRAMQAVPQKGLGYGLLRYLSLDDLPPDQSPRREICTIRPSISFNYLGQIDAHSLVAQTALPDAQEMQAGIALSREARGPERAPASPRTHLLEIECVIAGESLQIEWTYSSQLHRPETISRLAQSCLQNLRQLIAWCRDVHSRQATSQPTAQEKRRSSVEHHPPRISQEYEIFGWSEAEMEDIFDEIEKLFEADDEDKG
jgi:non-ribosomal peptide synthase protein (TIGR01720 family)